MDSRSLMLLPEQQEEILALEECLQILEGLLQVRNVDLKQALSKISVRLIWLLCHYPNRTFRLNQYRDQIFRLHQILNPLHSPNQSHKPSLSPL